MMSYYTDYVILYRYISSNFKNQSFEPHDTRFKSAVILILCRLDPSILANLSTLIFSSQYKHKKKLLQN